MGTCVPRGGDVQSSNQVHQVFESCNARRGQEGLVARLVYDPPKRCHKVSLTVSPSEIQNSTMVPHGPGRRPTMSYEYQACFVLPDAPVKPSSLLAHHQAFGMDFSQSNSILRWDGEHIVEELDQLRDWAAFADDV